MIHDITIRYWHLVQSLDTIARDYDACVRVARQHPGLLPEEVRLELESIAGTIDEAWWRLCRLHAHLGDLRHPADTPR